jgi:hypothetical protein
MTAPQVPLEETPPNPLLENQNNPNPDPNSPNPPSTVAPSTELPKKTYSEEDLKRTHELYGSALQEAEGKRKTLERELEEARARTQQPVIDDSSLTPEQLISREVKKSVQPLLDEFSQFRLANQQTQYQVIKNQFRQLPQISPYFTQLEPYIDQEMQGKEPTVQNLHAATAKVIGMAMLQSNPQQNNQQPQFQQQPPQQNQNPNQNPMLPPQVRPSNPPAPTRNGPNKPNRQLTELEKRVAREQGLSEEQYLEWLDVDPAQVVKSRIGLPDPPKK